MAAATFGQLAYEAYAEHCGGRSVHGDPLPSWDGQSPVICGHWEAAAQAVAEAVEERQG
jgi:hypothetical protein